MINVSNEYKVAMEKPIRNRAYVSIGIGIINQEAQDRANVVTDTSYWSNGNIFESNLNRIEYATMEQNYFRADGSMYFVPEENEDMQLRDNGLTTVNIYDAVRIEFDDIYAVKGLTIEFGSAYPTMFTIQTNELEKTYTLDNSRFVTNDVLGDIDHIIITPLEMSGGQQRMHINSILMGVGLVYTNKETKNLSLTETVSTISAEIPSETLNYSFFDMNNLFNIDDDNSYIAFLDEMQKVTVSFGIELDNGNVEWHRIATMFLNEWQSQKGVVSITATDRLSHMEDTYVSGFKIYRRTAYEEAEKIFASAGIEPDEYFIDDYLNDVMLENPMPEATHKECLQMLANACRCVIRQDENGRIIIRANFANMIEPETLTINTNGVAKWSKPNNLFKGTAINYADMTMNYFKSDASMYFMPEGENYLDTAYVSQQISDGNGLFELNPTISIILPAKYSYFGVNFDFGGNPPKEIIIHTYDGENLLESTYFEVTEQITSIVHDFLRFDKMVIEFVETEPHNRIIVNQFGLGDLSDYTLTKRSMLEEPIGYREKRTKAINVRVFAYENDDDGFPVQLESEDYKTVYVGEVGETKLLENPLINTEEHALLVGEWVGNYYANNVSYSVSYRGEPRINASDIIYMESDVLDNLQVEITKSVLNYNGAFSGSLELRRALKMIGE